MKNSISESLTSDYIFERRQLSAFRMDVMSWLGSLKSVASTLGQAAAWKTTQQLRSQVNSLQDKLTATHERLRDSFHAESNLKAENAELKVKIQAEQAKYKIARGAVQRLKTDLSAEQKARTELERQHALLVEMLHSLPSRGPAPPRQMAEPPLLGVQLRQSRPDGDT